MSGDKLSMKTMVGVIPDIHDECTLGSLCDVIEDDVTSEGIILEDAVTIWKMGLAAWKIREYGVNSRPSSLEMYFWGREVEVLRGDHEGFVGRVLPSNGKPSGIVEILDIENQSSCFISIESIKLKNELDGSDPEFRK